MSLNINFNVLLGKAIDVQPGQGDIREILDEFPSMGKALECLTVIANACLDFSRRSFPEGRITRDVPVTMKDRNVTVYRNWILSLSGGPYTVTTSIGNASHDVVSIAVNDVKGTASFSNMDWLEWFMESEQDILELIELKRKRQAAVMKSACEKWYKKASGEGKRK